MWLCREEIKLRLTQLHFSSLFPVAILQISSLFQWIPVNSPGKFPVLNIPGIYGSSTLHVLECGTAQTTQIQFVQTNRVSSVAHDELCQTPKLIQSANKCILRNDKSHLLNLKRGIFTGYSTLAPPHLRLLLAKQESTSAFEIQKLVFSFRNVRQFSNQGIKMTQGSQLMFFFNLKNH